MASSEPGRVAQYAKSPKNIAGCALAVGAPVLVVAGVVTAPVGVVLVPMFYAVGAFAAPARRRRAAQQYAGGVEPRDVRKSLADTKRRIYGHVPMTVAAKVDKISDVILATLPRADALGRSAAGQHALVRCATDYLPNTLQTYLDLPRNYADHTVVADGKTPLTILKEQLDLLATEIGEIADAVNQADTDKMLANGRFLAEKFGHGELDLDDDGGPA